MLETLIGMVLMVAGAMVLRFAYLLFRIQIGTDDTWAIRQRIKSQR